MSMTDVDPDTDPDVSSAAPSADGGGATSPQGAIPRQAPPDTSDDVTGAIGATGGAPPAPSPTPKEEGSHPLTDLVKGIMQYGLFKHGIDQPPPKQQAQAIPSGVAQSDLGSGQSAFLPSEGILPPAARKGLEGALNVGAGLAMGNPASGAAEAINLGTSAVNDAAQAYAKRVKRFIMGADAMDANSVEAIYHAVDPNGTLPLAERNYRAYMYANKTAGPDAMHSFLQYQRVKYDSVKSWTAGAYNQGNVASAIDGANKMFETIPSTGHVDFSANANNGIMASVVTADGKATAYTLTPDQFKTMLTTKTGVFDKIAGMDMNKYFASLSGAAGEVRGPAYKTVNPQTGEGFYHDKADENSLNEKREAGRAQLEYVANKRGPNPVGGAVGPSKNETADVKARGQLDQGARKLDIQHERVAGKNANEAASNQTRQQRVEGQNANEQTRAKNYAERTQERSQTLDKQTVAKLQMAANALKSRERTAKQQEDGRKLSGILRYMGQPGTDLDTLDKEFKKHGLSLNQFLPAGSAGGGAQPAPKAPTTSAPVPGAAQVAPPGAAGKDAQGRYVDKFGDPL